MEGESVPTHRYQASHGANTRIGDVFAFSSDVEKTVRATDLVAIPVFTENRI